MRHTAEPGTWWLRAAAVLLATSGLVEIVYMPILGPTGVIWGAFGVARLIAGAGVLRRQEWARGLGVVLTVPGLLADAIGLVGAVARLEPATAAMAVGSLATGFVVLFALLRRWPQPVPA